LTLGLTICADDNPGAAGSIAFVQKLQTPSGAFLLTPPAANAKGTPTIRATASAVRALHNLGGKLPNSEAVTKFVASCYDAAAGGFAETPGGKAEYLATTNGLMTVRDLGMPLEPYVEGATKYVTANAKTFEEIRVAAATFEKLERKAPKRDAWIAEIKKMGNADGTFGSGPGQARATGGAAAAIMRLGGKLDQRDNVLKALRAGQRPNGGFGKGESATDADLESSYRIMRCLMMLNEKPARVEAFRSYIAKCRNEDGGYSIAPGEMSSLNGTYDITRRLF
jgi:prenyltransferase beta subunit